LLTQFSAVGIDRAGTQDGTGGKLRFDAGTGAHICPGGITLIISAPSLKKTVVGMGTPPRAAAEYTQFAFVDGVSTVFSPTRKGPVTSKPSKPTVISFSSFRFPQS